MLLFLLLLPLSHGLRFHPYFTPGMVLQRDAANIIWGYDAVGEVRATLSCSGKKDGRKNEQSIGSVVISAEGLWQVELPQRSAGMICDFEAISDTEELVLEDLLIGDVWLCSGQSNMEQSMSNIMNATEEIEASASFPTIRYTVVENAFSGTANPDAEVQLAQAWADSADKEKLGGMSAVCFLFARSLQQMWQADGEEVIPLGLIDSDWGGTPIEAWSTTESLASCDAPITESCNDDYPHHCPSQLFNAMILPLYRVALKGFLWYQGESNMNEKNNMDIYNCTFPAMVNAWRQEFSVPDAPFGLVQLASWRPDTLDPGFPLIRWHLTADMGFVPNDHLPNVFMASPLDTYDDKEGYPGNIHTRYKQIVGERLAVAGMYVAYGKQDQAYKPYGPFPVSVNLDADLRKITVTYDQDIIYDSAEISGFYICQNGEDACDSAATLEQWEEVPKANTMLEDSRSISIQMDTIITKESVDLFCLAYAWRETPVKRYLGLPVYGTEAHYSLPSPPWKTQIMDSKMVD